MSYLAVIFGIPTVAAMLAAAKVRRFGHRAQCRTAAWVYAVAILGGAIGYLVGFWMIGFEADDWEDWDILLPTLYSGPFGILIGSFLGYAVSVLRILP